MLASSVVTLHNNHDERSLSFMDVDLDVDLDMGSLKLNSQLEPVYDIDPCDPGDVDIFSARDLRELDDEDLSFLTCLESDCSKRQPRYWKDVDSSSPLSDRPNTPRPIKRDELMCDEEMSEDEVSCGSPPCAAIGNEWWSQVVRGLSPPGAPRKIYKETFRQDLLPKRLNLVF